MKTKIQIFQPAPDLPQQAIPAFFVNQQKLIMEFAIMQMRIYGIARITIKPSMIGVHMVKDITQQALAIDAPAIAKTARSTVIRSISDLMLLVGILEIIIAPNADELEIIEKSWEDLLKTTSTTDLRNDKNRNIPLNVETDPSIEPVIVP